MALLRRKLFLFGLAAAVFLLGLQLWRRPARDLLQQAQFLESTRGWFTNDRIYSGYFVSKYFHSSSYSWRGAEALLYIGGAKESGFEAWQLHLPDGRRTALPDLNPSLHAAENSPAPFFWQPSPDGRWLLSMKPEGGNVIYTAREIDAAREVKWTNRFELSLPVWLHNSRGFVEWSSRDGRLTARLCRLDSPASQTFEVEAETATPWPGPLDANAGLAVLPVTDDLQIAGEIGVFVLKPETAAFRRHSFQVPRHLSPSDCLVFVSPAGDRLAWLLFFKQRWPRVVRHPAFPYFDVEPRFVVSLSVSRIDGGGIQEIGHLNPGEEIKRLAWTPDGKRLSFVYGDGLWMVPVN